jgi:8-oxo-dGTP diphosphatase
MKTYYTLGFLFEHGRERVVLMKKRRPDWQRGKLNGIGGHVEENETPDTCMAREFGEEVECDQEILWHGFAMMRGPDWEVFCYRAEAAPGLKVKAKTDEPIIITSRWTALNVVENLPWLIELAKDSMADGRPFYSYIDY